MARRTVYSMLGGLALAGLVAGSALAQKGPQQAPDPMLGTWRVSGQNVVDCRLSTPTGSLQVLRANGDGTYAVRLALTWRSEALPNCPPPEQPTSEVNAEGTIRREGRRVTLEIVFANGERGGPWDYEMEQGDRAMRFQCQQCIKTTFRWER